MEEIMTDEENVDKEDSCDTIDIPAHQQIYFTYVNSEDLKMDRFVKALEARYQAQIEEALAVIDSTLIRQ